MNKLFKIKIIQPKFDELYKEYEEKNKTNSPLEKEIEAYALPLEPQGPSMMISENGVSITVIPNKNEEKINNKANVRQKIRSSKEKWYQNRTIQAALITGFIALLIFILSLFL